MQQPTNKNNADNTLNSESGSIKITLTIPKSLLKQVEITAQRDYTTRSDVIRQALVDYLRQYERACGELEPEEALKILRRRMGLAYFNKTLKETKSDSD